MPKLIILGCCSSQTLKKKKFDKACCYHNELFKPPVAVKKISNLEYEINKIVTQKYRENLGIKSNKSRRRRIKDIKASPIESDQSLNIHSKKVDELKGDVDKLINENEFNEDMIIQKNTKSD